MGRKSVIIKSSISGILFAALLSLFLTKNNSAPYERIQQLNSNCPPGFKRNQNNECIAQNLYMQYNSPNNIGVGSLKTALPEIRDGFSPQQIDLGRYLFFDPILSGNGTMACASCHNPAKGFSDGMPTSIGNNNQKLQRSAPTLWNVAYLRKFFWDGRANSLEAQLQGPLFSEVEMNNSPENLLNTLNSIEAYEELFREAFPKKRTET